MRGAFEGFDEGDDRGCAHGMTGVRVRPGSNTLPSGPAATLAARTADGTAGSSRSTTRRQAWLGDTRESVARGLERRSTRRGRYATNGLHFVAAPSRRLTARRAAGSGPGTPWPSSLRRGQSRRVGRARRRSAARRIEMLAELHAARRRSVRPHESASISPGRATARARRRGARRPGPAARTPSRHARVSHDSAPITELLGLADRLAAESRRAAHWVITHGEPHAGNVMRTANGHVLVDWDTVALAPPERDLWMVAGNDTASYTRATGHEPDAVAIDYFRLTWDLKDLAEYLQQVPLTAASTRTPCARSSSCELRLDPDQWADASTEPMQDGRRVGGPAAAPPGLHHGAGSPQEEALARTPHRSVSRFACPRAIRAASPTRVAVCG